MTALPMPLVDVAWLAAHRDEPDVIVLDASVPPVVPGFESVNADGQARIIPGARRFDYDRDICDRDSALPHMMPSTEAFTQAARELGLGKDSLVVVYDDVGLYASPRAWWMFRAMGHRAVAVLDGGLPAWLQANLPVASAHGQAAGRGDFQADPAPLGFCGAATVLRATSDSQCTILDARSAGRFHGTAPEPRPNTRSGHMPGAKNLPFANVLDGHFMKPVAELRSLLNPLANPDSKLIASCGSGITACVLTLAAELAGYRQLEVYDGSWAEWGQSEDLPVVLD